MNTQLELPILCRIDAPSVLHPDEIARLKTWRDAVLLCWSKRRDKSDGAQSACARWCGIQVSHMSSYLSDDQKQRDMPAKYAKAFQAWCGVAVLGQFQAREAALSVTQEVEVLLQRKTA